MFKYKVEDILLSKKVTKVINEDFYIFEADNFLPLDFYLALEKSFPERSLLESEKRFYDRFVLKFDARYKPDESIILNKRANDFFKKSPEWAYFISLLTDNKFVYDVLDLLDKPICDQRGFKYSFGKKKYSKYVKNPKLVKNKLVKNKLVKKLVNNFSLVNNISVNFMFSSTGTSEALSTHTDSPHKLFTLLLYFPEKNWRSEYHGQTIFFKSKNNLNQDKKSKWNLLGKKNTHIPDSKLLTEFYDNYTELYKSKYTPNMLAGFVRNDKSWHSVGSMTLPKDIFRKVFVINFTSFHPLDWSVRVRNIISRLIGYVKF